MFVVGVRKNTCSAPFLEAQYLHSWSRWKANVCIFFKSPSENFYSREVVNFVGLINVLQADRCLGLVECSKIFDFN